MSDKIKHGECGHFCEACARRDDEIKSLRAQLEKNDPVMFKAMQEDDEERASLRAQLAERDAMLASAVGVLQKVVNPSYSHPTIPNATTRYMRREIIAMASDVLSSLPATAKASAKIIEAEEEQELPEPAACAQWWEQNAYNASEITMLRSHPCVESYFSGRRKLNLYTADQMRSYAEKCVSAVREKKELKP